MGYPLPVAKHDIRPRHQLLQCFYDSRAFPEREKPRHIGKARSFFSNYIFTMLKAGIGKE
jgi:hypothetical protein